MNKIKKGDDVVVLTGKDAGKRGVVLTLSEDRVTVEGVNLLKRNIKPNPQAQDPVVRQGGIVEQEASVHISNIALFNPITSKPDRVGIRTLEDGRKVRFFKTNDEVVDV